MSTEVKRCPWCLGFQDYRDYHDNEWGVPVIDDAKQFEFLVLESAQAGLSWATILKKRASYRKAFADFDPVLVSQYTANDVSELLSNTGIIRNEAKIKAAINNAQKFLKVQEQHGSFAKFIWSFVDGKQIQNEWKELSEVPATTAISDALAKEMKKLGFKFLGSTTLYAHLQATGLVNDHLTSCHRFEEIRNKYFHKTLI